MKLTILKKIMGLSVFIAVSMSCAIFAIALYFMKHGFDESSLQRVRTVRDVMSHLVESAQTKYREEVLQIVDNEAFIKQSGVFQSRVTLHVFQNLPFKTLCLPFVIKKHNDSLYFLT